jgi:acyl-CoA synthetase (AMP-forming)/AMP-acid ligase II
MDLVSWTLGPSSVESNTPILLDPEDIECSLTLNEIRTQVKQLIAGLNQQGISPGECVMVNSFNDIQYTVLYLGIIGSGAIFTGVNPSHSKLEILHQMQLTKPRIIIAQPDTLENTMFAANVMNIPADKIFIFDPFWEVPGAEFRSWQYLLDQGEADWKQDMGTNMKVVQYASTSGTSGLPKIAEITNAYHVSQAEKLLVHSEAPYHIRRLTPLPPFHTFATPVIPASIRQGFPVYVMRRFDMDKFLKYVKQYSITETYIPPPVIVAMPRHPKCTAKNLASLRQIWFGGAALKFSSCIPLVRLLHKDAKIQPVWGMTEAGWITAGRSDGPLITDDSVGAPLDGFEVKVVSEDGSEQQEGSTGELLVKSPAPMSGYLRNLDATREVIDTQGWIHTGDIGFMRNGRVSIIDRLKDIIKVRAWQVSPAEVEAALLEHPDIIDAAVVGVLLPDETGDTPKAFLVRRPGASVQIEDILAYLPSRLARYKVPTEWVFVESIPRNSTGKILRQYLQMLD